MLGNAEMVGRLVLAALLGSVIGFERERLLWAAGLRTHMLVCVGACLIMLVSAFGFGDALGRPGVTLDPSRVAAQVVSGIGFLGAGTILLRGEVVKGLTTAASLWAVAAIGLAIGGGLYVPALAATVIVVAILAGVKPIEERWRSRMQTRSLRIVARTGEITLDVLHAITGERASRVKQFVVRPNDRDGYEEVTIAFVRLSATSVEAIARELRAQEGVERVETV
ncbi:MULTISPECIES: MgtC/SapB family protein [Methylobacterium]|uniref:Protein MgtC n=1 Tax=Methylobacterium jeotgali TaxID=381630 RepID=A0ABQ4SYJ1_9HYPH|nr:MULTISPECIES: MgtC/SapB family protein [Methylobacterium]PIU07136.1 MAG: methyltransferase [Methylobacterium sp. CG09_land_8_20_14_0_10_71_15]PIU15627.1 MAG: methyltransferase [Methylobacterium sp. CG08_land_8_20_14_0_20_71_15]GBU18914.1 Mg(2+) transport ATPase [Methylobacterium sp.]GJE08295.1 Protein SapB [Methylobacterium jeotgali]